MAERLNVPGSRRVPLVDKDQEKYFKQLQDLGYVPQKYKNLQDLGDDYFELVLNQGKSEKEAAEMLGVNYKNVIGKGFLKLNVSSTGEPRAIEMRALREDIKPDERMFIEQRYGKGFLEDLIRLRELEWGDKKPKKGENVAELQARIYDAMDNSTYPSGESPFPFRSAKEEADIVRDRLQAAFGKSGQGSQVHRGHGFSALEGAGVGKANLEPELGPLNVAHGSAPRLDPEVMKALNMSSGDLQNLYDGYLTYKGLDINEARYFGTLLAADEGLRELQQGTNISQPEASTPENPPAVAQESIEWRNRRLNEIEQQLQVGLENSGMDPQDAAIEARNRIQEMSYQQSSLFDTTQSTGGPVTVTQTKRPYTVATPATTKIDEFGREKKVKAQTRVQYQEINPRGLAQNGGKVRFSRTRQLVKGATKVIPGPVDDLLVGGAMATVVAGGVLITGGSPAQAAQAATDTGIDYATGDLSGGDLAPATITDSQRNPTTYGLKGPDMSQPPMSTSSADILTDPTTKPQQPKSAAAKIIDDPLNELEYASKQALRGIKKIGGAILFGF